MFSPLRSFKQEPEFLELRGFIKNDLLHEVLMREYLKSRLDRVWTRIERWTGVEVLLSWS